MADPAAARHSKATPRWGTPEDLVARARRVMRGIDLDPCSSDFFQKTVQATRHYSLDDRGEDGLVLPWSGRVFCNPPGGLVREFWQRAMSQPVDMMLWVGFSVEQLCLLADEEYHPSDFSWCILRKRISFYRHDGYEGSPGHGNYVAGVGIPGPDFEEVFGELGRVQHGRLAI